MSVEGAFISITWGFMALGSYLTFRILKHIKEKPPGAQTLLDGIHHQMLWIWMVQNWMVLLQVGFTKVVLRQVVLRQFDPRKIVQRQFIHKLVMVFKVTIGNWGFKSVVTAWMFGYGTYVFIFISAVHLLICVVTRIGLVFFQDVFESVPEDYILMGTK